MQETENTLEKVEDIQETQEDILWKMIWKMDMKEAIHIEEEEAEQQEDICTDQIIQDFPVTEWIWKATEIKKENIAIPEILQAKKEC